MQLQREGACIVDRADLAGLDRIEGRQEVAEQGRPIGAMPCNCRRLAADFDHKRLVGAVARDKFDGADGAIAQGDRKIRMARAADDLVGRERAAALHCHSLDPCRQITDKGVIHKARRVHRIAIDDNIGAEFPHVEAQCRIHRDARRQRQRAAARQARNFTEVDACAKLQVADDRQLREIGQVPGDGVFRRVIGKAERRQNILHIGERAAETQRIAEIERKISEIVE